MGLHGCIHDSEKSTICILTGKEAEVLHVFLK